ncbi:MAG: lipoate--protein ligase [Rhodobacteraceae bacterium]|nr:lipoate--protein ligase [Paracoccaceae bacterium]MBT26983.1 lipoate--protein ligase [Paracoccaceae bacterium]
MIVAGFDTASDGIAREMVLLQQARPALLLWHSKAPALVLPAALMRQADVQQAAAQVGGLGWPVVTRRSGGGIVPQGPGTLNLALVLPAAQGFRLEDGYRLICGAVAEALSRFDIRATTGACDHAFCDGAWNVLVAGRKLAGTAQRWRSAATGPVVLAHAAILMARPDAAFWPVMDALHRAAFPGSDGLRPAAHVALADLIGARTNPESFPGALARAAEDRLTSLMRRDYQAA